MSNWLENIKSYIDFFRGRYEYRFEKDHDVCKNFFAEVLLSELQRYEEMSDVSTEGHVFITCYDKKYNRLIGCMDFIKAKSIVNNKSYMDFYNLNKFPLEVIEKIAVIDHLAILPEYRKKLISAGFFTEIYKYLLDNDFNYLFIVCEPGLIHLYTQLGFKPTGEINQWLDGVPVVHLYGYPRNYFEVSKFIPFFFIALSRGFPKAKNKFKLEQYISTKNDNLGFRFLTPNEIDEFDTLLTTNLSKVAKRSIFEDAVLIFPKKNESVIMQFDGSKSLAIVYSGSFSVMIDKFEIAILGTGNVIGEMAYVLKIPRSTSVVSREENSSILILGLSAFQTLNKKELLKIWKNLANIEARRLHAVDQKLRKFIKDHEK